MKINLYEATITVNEKERRLTKAIAKQFPIISGRERCHNLETGIAQPEPLCKVAGLVLGKELWTWLYLIEDEVAGLKWVAVNELDPGYKKIIVERGGQIDDPAAVPTVIL